MPCEHCIDRSLGLEHVWFSLGEQFPAQDDQEIASFWSILLCSTASPSVLRVFSSYGVLGLGLFKRRL